MATSEEREVTVKTIVKDLGDGLILRRACMPEAAGALPSRMNGCKHGRAS